MLKLHFQLLADYNASINQKICTSIANTSNKTLLEDKDAFFGSILGTHNQMDIDIGTTD